MKKKIIFQKCNFNYIYFLLYILTYILGSIIDIFLNQNESQKDEPATKAPEKVDNLIINEMLNIFSLNLSDFIGIIPYLIRKILLRNSNVEKNERKDLKKLIYNDQLDYKNRRKKLIFYFFLIATFDYLKNFIVILFYIISHGTESTSIPFNHTVIFDMIIQFIFSYLILGIHFYKLQRFSLYLNVVIFVIILALDLVDILQFKIIKGYIYIHYFF